MNTAPKPKILYFRWPLPESEHPLRFLQEQEITDRLSVHFEIAIHESDGEYRQLIDLHRPDLALFEHKHVRSRQPQISGVRGNRSVPKAMLIRSDTFCSSRTELLKDVDRLDVDACFAADTLYPYALEALRGRLYCEPHSIDPARFRDLGLKKTSVVTFFGHFQPRRPWRIAAAQRLHEAFPCVFWPHDTPSTTAHSTRMTFGDPYIEALNSSEFAPVEGGFQNLFTRKFFEVPAAGCCMVVPPFPELEEFGFVDMETCITAEPSEIVEKLDFVKRDPVLYKRIATSGMALVHGRHSQANRTQIRDWLDAFRSAPPGSAIVQKGIFGPFVAGAGSRPPTSLMRSTPPIDYFLLSRAARRIRKRKLDAAEHDLLSCASLAYQHFPEPNFYLAVLRLLQGRWLEALYFVSNIFVKKLAAQGVTTLDPRQAAILAVCYLCGGKSDKARQVLILHENLKHRELSFARRLVGLPDKHASEIPNSSTLFYHLPLGSRVDWAKFVEDAALAHGRTELAERAREFGIPSVAAGKEGAR